MDKRCVQCFAPIGENVVCSRCGFNNAAYRPGRMHLRPGTLLNGRYTIGMVMGEGGFGITYAGYDPVLSRKVAIKEYFPYGIAARDLSKSPNVTCRAGQDPALFEIGRKKSIREAQSLAQFEDVNSIVHILDFFSENNTAYIIMEFVEGVTLNRYAQRLPQKMTLPQILHLLRPVTDAAQTIHARGFVHRDISPDNIMITQNGTAKLLDFGAARVVAGEGSSTEYPVSKRSFSPIELYTDGGLIGPWTDVYCLSSTIYYLLTGCKVAEPTERLTEDHTAEKLEGLLSPSQKEALLQGLAVQREDRIASVPALISRLHSETPTVMLPAQNEQPQSPKSSNAKKKRIAVCTLFALAAAAVAIGLLLHSQEISEPETTEASATETQQAQTTAETQTEPETTAAVTEEATTSAEEETTARTTAAAAAAKDSTTAAEAASEPSDDGTESDAHYPAAFTVSTPSVTYSGSPAYSNAQIAVYAPSGMRFVDAQKAGFDRKGSDVILADKEIQSDISESDTCLMAGTVAIDGRYYIRDSVAEDIASEYNMPVDAFQASQDRSDALSDASSRSVTVSAMYQMQIGKQTWFCFDQVSADGRCRTQAYCYFNNHVTKLTAYSSDTQSARALLYQNVDTK